MKIFLSFLFCLSLGFVSAQLPQTFHRAVGGPGGADTAPPGMTITTNDTDPVVGTTGVTYVTYNFASTKATGDFTSGDITPSNAIVSVFTTVDATHWTARITPQSNGTFGAQVTANKYTDARGAFNTASNNLTMTFSDASGFTYDLQNATITVSKHYRGHVASFSECNDFFSTQSQPGIEMLHTKYNRHHTQHCTADNQSIEDQWNFGSNDIGQMVFGSTPTTSNFDDIAPLVTAARGGHPATAGGYKNGYDAYKNTLLGKIIYMRNSNFEYFPTNHKLDHLYANFTPDSLISKAVTFRSDYYWRTLPGVADYYQGSLATGDAKLPTYINKVLTNTGWFTNFYHDHWQWYNYIEHYFNLANTSIGSADVFFSGTSKIAEYYWTKEAITSVSGSGSLVTINYAKDYPTQVPYSNITTEAWFKFNLAGTGYAGHGITTTATGAKIRSMGSDLYYIGVPLDFTLTSTSFNIFVSPSPSYINLTPPVIQRTGNAVTCDQSCTFSVWRYQKPTSLTSSSTSITIPGDNVNITLTVGTGLSIPVDTDLRLTADGSHYFYAVVTSYTSGSGSLSITSVCDAIGSGTFSSWTVDTFHYPISATLVERKLTPSTSYTIAATLDEVNYTYVVGAVNSEGISSTIP